MICRSIFTVIPLILITFAHGLQAQTLFTYGNKPVTKAEFLRAYEKTKTLERPTEQSYRDYLDLYMKFKIKVQAARDMRLDTLASLKAELQNFRSQIAENFLNDEASMNELIDEAFVRGQKDIRIAHIFVRVGKEDSVSQRQKAQAKINKAYEALKQRSFEEVALEYSDDPAVKTGKGVIGWVTVFVLPYSIENIVYGMPIGQWSKPFRSANGFHIFKNLESRKAMGRLKAAQILLSHTPNGLEKQKDAKAKGDSILKALQKGADFKTLALQFSSDNLSYQNGGELPEFGVGRYDPVFETAAFALQNDGDISQPVYTEFGYHIIKRLDHIPAQTDKGDEKWRENIKKMISQSDRMEVLRKKLIKNIQLKTNFRKFPYNQKNLWRLTDSILANKNTPQLPDINLTTPLFAFAGQTIRVRDWRNYLESVRSIQSLVAGKKNDEIFNQFVETSTFDYYRNHLEEFNPELVYQMNEFRDGNLLFEVMQHKVWDPASLDSAGLRNFYEKNKSRYWWENSTDAIIFTCNDSAGAESLKAALRSDINGWKKATDESNGSIQADSGRFELEQIPVVDRTNFTEELFTASVKNEADNSVSFAYIIKLHNKREPRTFTDARGFVINDYQEYLENKWVLELRKKYPIKVNEVVFASLPK